MKEIKDRNKNRMFCTHPIHTIKTRGKPRNLTEIELQDRHCFERKCRYLFIDKDKRITGV